MMTSKILHTFMSLHFIFVYVSCSQTLHSRQHCLSTFLKKKNCPQSSMSPLLVRFPPVCPLSSSEAKISSLLMHQGIYNQASAHFYCARNFNKFRSFLQEQWYRFTIVFPGVWAESRRQNRDSNSDTCSTDRRNIYIYIFGYSLTHASVLGNHTVCAQTYTLSHTAVIK